MSLVENPASTAPEQSSSPASYTTASLYIGELDPSVTEAMLFEMFNTVGPVSSIRVCRDAATRRSLGYAYVNFHRVEDAEEALDRLNYTLIKGRSCRIMWSQRDPSMRKGNNGNIFIKNLDPAIDHKALHDTFSAFGNILSCKIAQDDGGNSKGYGFVHYETQESAESAIKNVNGMLLNDRKVFVGHHLSKRERESQSGTQRIQFTNVYAKNIPLSVSDEELSQLFETYGTVTSCLITRDEKGSSKGFGFVNFEKPDDAQKAVDALHGKEYKGQEIYVSRAQKKNEREEELRRQYEEAKMEKMSKFQGVNLYVKNLDDDIDDNRLRDEFSVYGTITSAKIMRDDKTAVSRGFGFVCFTSPDEATRAVTEMNGRILGSKPIYVAIAQRKEVRRSQLEMQMAQRNQAKQSIMPPMYGSNMYGPPAGMVAPAPRSPFQGAPMPYPTQGYPAAQRPAAPQPARPAEPAVRTLTAQELATFPPEAQKQMLGERLYPIM
ncbi:hypothetical protein BY458DRAFT_535209 [Sporodiniella umbellata]|nr:hypothetical protein BY458DRAFT_535209 [Sporodiniella umbellata]